MFNLRVWGRMACFTQPPLKAERSTYRVITPTAAKGVFDSVYRGDDMFWGIHRIYVLNPIKFQSIKTNEVSTKIKPRSSYIVPAENRIQRTSEILRDVEYVISAGIYPIDEAKLNSPGFYGKHTNIFLRKARQGAHWQRPYLGLREFMAHWDFVADDELPAVAEQAKALGDVDFGTMLCAFDYDTPGYPALFYHAIMRDGVIEVPCNTQGKYDATEQAAVQCVG